MRKYFLPLLACIIFVACDSIQKSEGEKQETKAYSQQGNVFILYPDSTIKQLTFSGNDISPIYLEGRNSVVFVRSKQGDQSIIVVNDSTLSEGVLVQNVRGLKSIDASMDQNWVLFSDSANLKSVDISTSSNKDFGQVTDYILVKESQYADHLIILNIIQDKETRGLEFKLKDIDGSTKKEFSDAGNLKSFVNQNIPSVYSELEDKLMITQRKLAYLDSIHISKLRLNELDIQLAKAETDLLKAKKRLSKIYEFQIGRSYSEKERQINDQNKLIDFKTQVLEEVRLKHNTERKTYFDLERRLNSL
ncbi:hypothetical protein [Marinoscillum sp. MHG1-6]|uniref:hypothetical protein n=1 Tax=Marinoscillum sp. MHG1-6 TaxID=2959627 RepID=UPI0021585387|nr:hypothetical protein [Marinoscillum sp. MHG1-6]